MFKRYHLRCAIPLVGAFLLVCSTATFAQEDSDTVEFGGDTKNVCTAIQYASRAVVENREFEEAKIREAKHKEKILELWAQIFAQLSFDSGVPIPLSIRRNWRRSSPSLKLKTRSLRKRRGSGPPLTSPAHHCQPPALATRPACWA